LRDDNDFTWFPIIEVAYLFIGIFITMIPCLLILKAGSHGALAFLTSGVTRPVHYFWVTGALSGFLDNAPTYLTFFNSALGAFYAGMSEAQAVPFANGRKRNLSQSDFGRCCFFWRLQLHRQRAEFYGSLHFRRSRYAHAEFLWLCFKICAGFFGANFYNRNICIF
jgi:hypothetical protein